MSVARAFDSASRTAGSPLASVTIEGGGTIQLGDKVWRAPARTTVTSERPLVLSAAFSQGAPGTSGTFNGRVAAINSEAANAANEGSIATEAKEKDTADTAEKRRANTKVETITE